MKGGCIPGKNKLKTQENNKLRWLTSDINFKLLHTGCPIADDGAHIVQRSLRFIGVLLYI